MNSSPVNRHDLATHKIGVVLLAAGRGSRMSGDVPKVLLPMRDKRPILAHALQNALALKPYRLVVVVRPDIISAAQSIGSTLEVAVEYTANPRFAEGMGTSLALGVATLSTLSPDAEGCLVLLGDEPLVPPAIVERLVTSFAEQQPAICMPLYGDQPGPPTLFSRDVFSDLTALEGDSGGRQLLGKYPGRIVRVPFAETDRPKDIDTWGDYEQIITNRP